MLELFEFNDLKSWYIGLNLRGFNLCKHEYEKKDLPLVLSLILNSNLY